MLNKALGEERAGSIIEDILESRDPGGGIDSLNWMDSTSVAELIRDEHPQIIATILIHRTARSRPRCWACSPTACATT